MARRAKLERRTESVTAPDAVAEYFGAAEWTVQQLTGAQLYKVREASNGEQEKLIRAISEALQAGDKRGELAAELVTGGDIPQQLRHQMSLVEAGLVEPRIDHEDIIALFDNWPIFGEQLGGIIAKLTGEGSQLVKPQRSTPTHPSEAH